MARNTVLLLEDDPTIRAALKGMLPGGKFEILEVGESQAALNVIKREVETLRLMVLKFRMPQIPGWKILQKAQAHPKLQKIPMMLVTQRGDPVQKAFPQPPQFFEILQYPCDRAQMQAAIKAAVAKAKRDRSQTAIPKAPPPPPAARKAPAPPPPPAARKAPVPPPPPPARKAPAPPPPPAAKKPVAPPPPPAPKPVAPPPAARPAPPPVQAPPAPKPPTPSVPKTAPPAPLKPEPIASQPTAVVTPTPKASKTFEPIPFSGGDPFAVGDRVSEPTGTSRASDDPFATAIATGAVPETTAPPATGNVDIYDPFAVSAVPTPTVDPFAQDPNNPFAEFVADPFDSEPVSSAASDPSDPFGGEFVADPFDPEPTVVDDQNPFAASVNFNVPSAMPPPTSSPPVHESLELDPGWQSSREDDSLAGAIASRETSETADDDDPFGGAVTSLDPLTSDDEDDDDDDPFAGAVMSLAGEELEEESDEKVSDEPPIAVSTPIEPPALDTPALTDAPEDVTPQDAIPESTSEGWDIPYEQFECLHCNAEARDRGVTGLAIDMEGRLFTCGPDVYVNRWSLYELTKELQFDLFSKSMECLALSPDGQLLLTGAPESNIKIWDVNSGMLVDTLSDQSMGALNLVMTPDAQTVVSTAARSNVKLWDYATGDFLGPLNDESIGATSVTLTPDGQTVLTGSQQSNIRFWDWATGELLGPLNIQSLGVTALVSSPDGQAVLSGDAQGMLTITDLTTGEPIRTLKAHEDPVDAIAISPDGWYIVTASRLEMKLWGCWPEEAEE